MINKTQSAVVIHLISYR